MGTPIQLSIDPQQLGIEFGSGAVIGGIIGFAAKKIAKLIAVIVGSNWRCSNSLRRAGSRGELERDRRGRTERDWHRRERGGDATAVLGLVAALGPAGQRWFHGRLPRRLQEGITRRRGAAACQSSSSSLTMRVSAVPLVMLFTLS